MHILLNALIDNTLRPGKMFTAVGHETRAQHTREVRRGSQNERGNVVHLDRLQEFGLSASSD
jgi:hypothetical protein